MRMILDIEVNSGEEFSDVMLELKHILPTRRACAALISAENHFNEDKKLNILTEEEIEAFNKRICGI
jgi:hypothetical protein